MEVLLDDNLIFTVETSETKSYLVMQLPFYHKFNFVHVYYYQQEKKVC